MANNKWEKLHEEAQAKSQAQQPESPDESVSGDADACGVDINEEDCSAQHVDSDLHTNEKVTETKDFDVDILAEHESAMHALEDKNTALSQEIKAYKDRLERVVAEMKNMETRYEKQLERTWLNASKKVIEDFLPMIDGFLQAKAANVSEDETHAEGFDMLYGILMDIMAKQGVTLIQPDKGVPFDPECHEAISMIPDPSVESQCIVDVVQPGLQIKERLVRAARVVVSQ